MLLKIHNGISNDEPRAIRNLIYLKLTLPNMDSSHGDILQPRNGMNYQMTLE